MSTFKPRISLDVLPRDSLAIKDDQFYNLVESLTSTDISRILRSQRINSINTFLLCKNVLESILLPTAAFDALRQEICVKLDQNSNNTYVIHVGIVGQIDYLTELFRKKHLQEVKPSPKRHSSSSAISIPNQPSSTSTSAFTSSLNSISIDVNTSSSRSQIADYRSNIISSIDKWFTSQRKSRGSNTLMAVEGTNYQLDFSPAMNTITIVCQCSTRLSLSKSIDSTFYLSNVYKHWKTAKGCNVLSSSTLSHSSPTPSSPILNNSPTNNDDDDDEDEDPDGHEDRGADDKADSNQSSTLVTRPNTRSASKRTNPYSHLRINEPSAKRRA